MGLLHRSPHSECLFSRCRSEGESSRSIRYVCRRPLSVRLSVCPGQAASLKPCVSLLFGTGWGVKALPSAQAPWPHCAGSVSWSESARIPPGLSWSHSDLLRGPLACWWFLPIRVVAARFAWAVTRVGPAASQLRQPLGPGWVCGASLWGGRRGGPHLGCSASLGACHRLMAPSQGWRPRALCLPSLAPGALTGPRGGCSCLSPGAGAAKFKA